jgi:hypothetical protein
MAEIIDSKIASDSRLMIALGNGGVASGIDNFSAMQKPGDILYSVRFSRNKEFYAEPILSEAEKEWLVETAKNRAVIINEDDVHLGLTMYEATKYFKRLLGTNVIYGIASNCAESSNTNFMPESVKLGSDGEVYFERLKLNEDESALTTYDSGKIKKRSWMDAADHHVDFTYSSI